MSLKHTKNADQTSQSLPACKPNAPTRLNSPVPGPLGTIDGVSLKLMRVVPASSSRQRRRGAAPLALPPAKLLKGVTHVAGRSVRRRFSRGVLKSEKLRIENDDRSHFLNTLLNMRSAVADGRSHVSRLCGSLILPVLEHPQPVCYH